jgi:hypothetical protein
MSAPTTTRPASPGATEVGRIVKALADRGYSIRLVGGGVVVSRWSVSHVARSRVDLAALARRLGVDLHDDAEVVRLAPRKGGTA